jgi:catechol 2,3-dioxygenase-like lactoylglutathione lyase family enzyme
MDVKLRVVSLWAEDVPKIAHFYRDVIGLRLMPHHGERPHFDLGGQYMVLVAGKPAIRAADSPDHFPVVAFSVDELESAIERLRIHDVNLPWGIQEGYGTRWIQFYDPAGNLIELVESLS